MKKRTTTSIDGFIPRRPNSQLGDLHERDEEVPIDRTLHTTEDGTGEVIGVARENRIIGRSDIDESLRELDNATPEENKTRRQRRADRKRDKKEARKKHKVRRIIKWVLLGLLVIALVAGGYLVYKAVNASDSVFKGSILDLVKTTPLKQDANGWSNFLIVGTSEDDPGHQGGNLTDSILVLSVNQTTKTAYTFSVPRDLYVQYGMACASGYSGKINVYFSCSDSGTDAASEQDRLTKTQAFIGNILGMDLQYGIHVNYTVMRDLVNAVGGSITVDIQGDDGSGPSSDLGIMDSNFDWKCGATRSIQIKNCPPDGHYIEYAPGPQVLDAEHALYLAQARGDIAPTYGLAQSNFDRERNQQKILVAIRDKALSTGTLTNIGAITSIINTMGQNLRTNIATDEIRTLMNLGKAIPDSSITSIDLYKAGEAQFTTQTIDGAGSVVVPAEGEFSYDALQTYLNKIITAEPFVKESPHVTVLNGSSTAGAAQTAADGLIAKGFTVDSVDNAPAGTYPAVTIYQINNNKPLTAAKLKSLYNVSLLTTTPPVTVPATTDFLIIIGTDPTTSQ
jgi:anionic cell wall polymer biosynthesis LytR-Cps2A-Psr (LCP) family protein